MCVRACEAEQIFTNVWHISNYDAQNQFIAGCIEQCNIAAYKVPAVRTKTIVRSYAQRYTVQTGNSPVTVCKPTFLSLLGISASNINTVLCSQRMNGVSLSLSQSEKFMIMAIKMNG